MILYVTARNEFEAKKQIELRWPEYKYEIKQIGAGRWEVRFYDHKNTVV